ncbi:MAG: patatin-like phospholipase family protein [Desulfonatronovibrio sp. MSAO_Bac4]|nr:MAG: patatin-like phospholipase family protein [Desulfonatronovibrio sp. MSAO_Bac4]
MSRKVAHKYQTKSNISRRNFLSSTLITAGILCTTGLMNAGKASGNQEDYPRIGLALGSGGATGLSHIPMLEVFDELGLKPSIIAGSSIGAIIGALYCSGLSGKEIRKIVNEFSGSGMDVFKALISGDSGLKIADMLRLDIDEGGLVDSQGFLNFLKHNIKQTDFEELSIPLKVVAADYWKREEVVFESGKIMPAVKASMAVPGLFAPVTIDERLLVDGGTVNPLPYDLIKKDCDILVAIDVSGVASKEQGKDPDFTDSLFNTFEIMQQAITSQKMKYIMPDIYIKPDVAGIRLLHFNRSELIFEQAAPAAQDLKNKLKELISHL